MVNRRFIILLLCSFPASMVYCQEGGIRVEEIRDTTGGQRGFHQEDIKDWLIQRKVLRDKPPKKNFLLIIPVVASNPTAGFMFVRG